mgnify:CR=1 FL=1
MNEREFDRTERIGAEMKRALAVLVRDQVKDPRLANITVHEVRGRAMPQLHFVHDESIAKGEHLSSLIEQAVAQERPATEEEH